MADEVTAVALLTPPGRGAIAALAVHGPDAWRITRSLFQPRTKQVLEPAVGRFWLGRMGSTSHGFDDVIFAVKELDPFPRVEIHCHGGAQVVRVLMTLLAEQGVQQCSWRELLAQTSPDHLQAAAAYWLSRAATMRTAAILLDQYHGAFREAVARVLQDMDAGKIAEAATALANLARRAPLGRRLTVPWRVVIAGAPNVGKSTLLNAIAGYTRSIVSPIPGATRDLVTTTVAIDGWPIELVDTAGWRSEAFPLEQEGIIRAQQAAREADLCLWLVDASANPVLPSSASFLLVINKIDLPAAWAPAEGVRISAQTGAGLEQLCRHISTWLVPSPPQPGEAVPFTSSLCEQVESAQACFAAGSLDEASHLLQVVLSRQ